MKNDRFIRWQTILREQISFLNSFLLTISIGVIGFLLTQLSADDFNPFCCQKIFFTLGLVLIFLSIWAGLGMAFSRLLDFRTTLKKIKNDKAASDDMDSEELKDLMKLYGKTTWCLLYTQIITLSFGLVNLTIAFCWIYSDKLFL